MSSCLMVWCSSRHFSLIMHHFFRSYWISLQWNWSVASLHAVARFQNLACQLVYYLHRQRFITERKPHILLAFSVFRQTFSKGMFTPVICLHVTVYIHINKQYCLVYFMEYSHVAVMRFFKAEWILIDILVIHKYYYFFLVY